MDLLFTEELDFWRVTGKTFIWKEEIKTLGGKWNPAQKAWRIPHATDISELKAAVLKKEVDYCVDLLLAFEAKEKATKEVIVVKAAKPWWVCCDKAVIVNAQYKWTTCTVHAVGDNTFRVRGGIFTGD